jgi:hypothetical protein
MKLILSFALTLFIICNSYSQINLHDSTVQVIGYWNNHEKQSYVVTHEKVKLNEMDTLSTEFFKYTVEVTIVDSTENSYTIDWYYHDYELQTDNPIMEKILSITEDMTIKIKTNEMGAFKEIVNWKQIRDYIYKATGLLKQETVSIPNMDKWIGQIENMYFSKEAIEASAINEIQQFYTYHGGRYKLNEEINTGMKVMNQYGGEPFDTDVTLWLDEINEMDNTSVLRMHQSVDPNQLTKATYHYLVFLSETLKIPGPKWEDIPPLSNEAWTASRIHGSGWPIYSVETRNVSAEGIVNTEETIIEIQ